MTRYPLLFLFRDRLDLRGDLVEVAIRGRALAVEEPGGWWMYGVVPGGLAECGVTASEAHAAFRKIFTRVLRDIADSSRDVKSFEVGVREFFSTNDPRQREWDEAVADVRAGRVTSDLPRERADSPRGVDVEVVKRAPRQLTLDPLMAIAA